MSADDRFKPPTAVVDDVGVAPSRGPLLTFGLAGLIQFSWVASKSGAFLQLVGANALSPIGLVFALAGELCLALAIYRAIWLKQRPQRMFAAAVVLLAVCVALWHGLPAFILGLFVAGIAIAAICWILGRARAPATPAAS